MKKSIALFASLLVILSTYSQSTTTLHIPGFNRHLGWDDNGNAPLWINQNNTNRMQFDSENHIGLANTSNNANRISLNLFANTPISSNLYSILQMGTLPTNSLERPWMNVGTTMGFRGDIMYTGLLNMPVGSYGSNSTAVVDAVIAWGCNDDNVQPQFGPDNLRFLFITPTNQTGAGIQQQGREVFRITPMGNTGIGDFSPMPSGINSQPAARLHVYNDNRPTAPVESSGNSQAVFIQNFCNTGFSQGLDLQSISTLFGNHSGIRSYSQGGTKNVAGDFWARGAIPNGSIYGVEATAQGADPQDYIYGVAGHTTGQAQFAAGIYGDVGVVLPNHWAGYFQGAGFISGGFWAGSDESLKTSIEDCTNALELLMPLEVKSYYFNDLAQAAMRCPGDLQYGLLAQQLEEQFPQFVRDAHSPPVLDSLGNTIYEGTAFKAVSYDFLVPLLVQGVKEQQTQIEMLNSRLDEMEALLAEAGLEKTMESKEGNSIRSDYELYQNKPNPFNTSTEIVWRMAEATQGRIIVHDDQGNLIKILQDANMSKGLHSIEWQAIDLPAGTYFYSLEVDGQLMVKRAIKLER